MKFKIKEWRIFNDFEIDFCDRNGNPLNLVVLAGVNGTGKSTVLEALYFYSHNKEKSKLFSVDEYKTSNGTSIENLFFLNPKKTLKFDFRDDFTTAINEAIKHYFDKKIYEDNLTAKHAIKDINNKIFKLIPDFNIKINEIIVENKTVKIGFINDWNHTFFAEELASGEELLLQTIFLLHFYDAKNSIILVDEPEESLHPNWQTKIVNLYRNYAKANDCLVVMATHSPFILSAVKSEQIRLLKRTPEGIKIEKIEEEINGWTIERILQYFMETDHVRDPKTDKEIAELFEMMKSGNFNNDSFKERFAVLEQRLGYADRLSYTDKDMVSLRMELNRLQKNEDN